VHSQKLVHDIEAQQYKLELIDQQRGDAPLELSDNLGQQLKDLELEFNSLRDDTVARCRQLEQVVAHLTGLQSALMKAVSWIEDHERLRAGRQDLPLLSADVKKTLNELEVPLLLIFHLCIVANSKNFNISLRRKKINTRNVHQRESVRNN
jgi:hypothetical protein